MSTTPRTLPFDRPDPMQPPPDYAQLRDSAPVARVVTPDGQSAWLVTSYDAVATVLSDPRFGLAPPGPAPPTLSRPTRSWTKFCAGKPG